LGNPLIESTGVYGETFESWVINEVVRLNAYYEQDLRLSFYRSKHVSEVDLILLKGKKSILVEITSSTNIDEQSILAFSNKAKDLFKDSSLIWVSRDPTRVDIDSVRCMSYKDFLNQWH
jgi:predicted AAA+ superfamily ATPase